MLLLILLVKITHTIKRCVFYLSNININILIDDNIESRVTGSVLETRLKVGKSYQKQVCSFQADARLQCECVYAFAASRNHTTRAGTLFPINLHLNVAGACKAGKKAFHTANASEIGFLKTDIESF